MKPIEVIKKAIVVLVLVATSAISGEIPSVDPTVSYVIQGGSWRQGDEYGTCRLIVRTMGWEETRSLVYLQWLRTDDKIRVQVEETTEPVKEMNDGEWMNVQMVNYKDGKFAIIYTTWSSRETKREAVINPKTPGKYIFITE